MLRRALLLLTCALAITACRLDVEVSLDLEPDGTGVVTVVAHADAGLVAQVPDLASVLVFTDATDAGWTLEGPSATDDGGLRVILTHPVASAQELANVLNSIGPPFADMRAGRTTESDQTTTAIDGRLVLPDGFESFADADLVAAVGGLPFADRFQATGATPEEALSVTFRVSMPGEVISSTGQEVESEVFEWQAPLDGSEVAVAASTVQRPPEASSWAAPLATAALIALVIWSAISVAFIAAVLVARRRRMRRRRTSRAPGVSRSTR